MADKSTQKLRPKDLQEDVDALAALDTFTDYNPSNPAFSKANAAAIKAKTLAKQEKEAQDYAAWQASRDGAVAAERERHDFVLGARAQVKAQYGENSDELQAMGLKKKSEYKKPTKKPKSPTS